MSQFHKHGITAQRLAIRSARSALRVPPVVRPAPAAEYPVFPTGNSTPQSSKVEDSRPVIEPLTASDRSGNELRPSSFDEMVGQERLKPLFRELVAHATASGQPLDHLLMVGASGTGKTTTAHVMACELGRRVFQIDAPVSFDMLAELREKMQEGDVLVIDEIHRQVAADRRGATAACQPEIFYAVLEDRRLHTAYGVLPFPRITVVGATTDAGLLPEPFLARFPLKPILDPYTVAEMAELARRNARALHVPITDDGALILARACRRNPRQLQTYIRNARSLASSIDRAAATRIVCDLNSTTLDGLTADMQGMLKFLLRSGRRESKTEGVYYQSGVNSIATALGKSRDSKAIALYVEPWLIEQGLVQVMPQGRRLTDAGVQRAEELLNAA